MTDNPPDDFGVVDSGHGHTLWERRGRKVALWFEPPPPEPAMPPWTLPSGIRPPDGWRWKL